MLGVAVQRLCPDQTATEAARKAYVAEALYQPPPAPKKPVVVKKPPAKRQYKWGSR